ncbi:MAG: hypothetical protein IJX38_01290 [Clostridia bacterium]|nr:hypothetical protein [Clostridia bacterium]
MKKRNLKRRLRILVVASYVVSVFPLLLCLVLRWDGYVSTPAESVKLSFGGLLICLLVLFKTLGKLRVPSGVLLYGAVFILAYLLKVILDDLVLLSGMALIGEIADLLLFRRAIKKTRENLVVDKTADATADKVEQIVKKYIGRC